jgi:peptide/nickel transport system permease protein
MMAVAGKLRSRSGSARRAAVLAVVLAVCAAGALATALVAPNAGARISLADGLAAPNSSHLLGQDKLGRDVAARVVAGARISLVVAIAAVSISLAIGTGVGAAAGWLGGPTDMLLMRLVDVLLAFPGLLLAIALAGALGPGIGNVIIALSVIGWTGYARLVRGEVRRIRRLDHVQAAFALGVPSRMVLLRHVLPLLAAPLAVQAAFSAATAVVAEASLSFLGIGVRPPTPSWGAMLAESRSFVIEAPHLVIAPGVAITALVLVLMLLGDALRDAMDVRS